MDGSHAFHQITLSIIQGSGIGPTLWIIMESDPCCMSLMNVLVNYAGYIGTRK